MAKSDDDDFWKGTEPIFNSVEDLAKARNYATDKGIKLDLPKNFDGDINLLIGQINALDMVMKDLPLKKPNVVLTVKKLEGMDFGVTLNKTITISMQALRDKAFTNNELNADNVLASKDIIGIVIHEYGHVIATEIGNKGIEIAMKAYQNLFGEADIDTVIKYLSAEVSGYAIYIDDSFRMKRFKQSYYREVISEVIAKYYTDSNAFAAEFVKILKEDYL